MSTFADLFALEPAQFTELAPVHFDMPTTRICSRVPCGKPTVIFNQVQGKLLSAYLSKNPSMTFLFEVTGDSMQDAGLHEGDLVAVDCQLEPHDGNIVLASINGELTLKRLCVRRNAITKLQEMSLLPANPRYKPILITEFDDAHIFGVASAKMTVQGLL